MFDALKRRISGQLLHAMEMRSLCLSVQKIRRGKCLEQLAMRKHLCS
jgi:hypothetical protein